MTGSAKTPLLLRMTAGTAAALISLGLAACAPEPDVIPEGKPAAESTEEPSWPESAADDADKVTVLPDSFPAEAVALPSGAEIDNAGDRGEGAWFVVLRAASLESASEMLDQIALDGGFEVTEDSEAGDGGRNATLTTDGYVVNALTLVEGKQALLSLDISSTQI